ncbi:MAG: zinc ribbon domain-containing protein [Cyanobacteria bacterium J06638_20]
MSTCPRCQQVVDPQAIVCPFCKVELKAHGHPGIELHRATKDSYLCDNCTYHADDTCNFTKRPYAKDCTLYRHVDAPIASAPVYKPSFHLKTWFRRNTTWLLLGLLIAISIFIALGR